MKNARVYGKPPYNVVLVHGGPGAAGEMAEVALELEKEYGVLEPFQTARSVQGQFRELKSCLKKECVPPVILAGYSWGAWLSLITASRYPKLVKKLVLISSGPFREEDAVHIQDTRLSRMTEEERKQMWSLMRIIKKNQGFRADKALQQLGQLISKADAWDPLPLKTEKIICSAGIFQSIWPEAVELRRSGQLLDFAKKTKCPVVAIHGDYDPHPARGVAEPLVEILPDFSFHLLKNCGHTPWREKQARDQFYQILRRELKGL